MNRPHFFIALLYCFALSGFVLGNSTIAAKETTKTAKEVMKSTKEVMKTSKEGTKSADEGMKSSKGRLEVAKEGIDAIDRAFDLYDKILDKVVPWSKLKEAITKLDDYRMDYSKEAAALIGDIKTKMLDGMDAYKRAVQSVFEWCRLSTDLLTDYSELMSDEIDQATFDDAQAFLHDVLDNGIKNMGAGQEALGNSSSSFNASAEKLAALNHQLKADFDPNSKYYQSRKSHIQAVAYGSAAPSSSLGLSIAAGVVEGKQIPELNEKMASIEKYYQDVTAEVQNSFKNIFDTKEKLQDELKHIGDVKLQMEAMNEGIDDNAEVKEALLKSIANLITKCKEYQNRHMDGK